MNIKNLNQLGFFGECFTRLFEDVGNQAHTSKAFFNNYPKEIYPILSTIYRLLDVSYIAEDNYPYYDIKPLKTALVGFSCGKDSVATIIKLKNQGYDVIAFAVQGINRQYPKELENAQKLCDMLEVPLVIYKISCLGKSEYFENPLKNLLILSYMLDYGIPLGITNYCLGTYVKDDFSGSNILYNWSDSCELLQMFSDFVKKFFPNYQYIHGLDIDNHPYKIILKSNYDTMELMNLIYSCITTNRFRMSLRKKNIEKFHLEDLFEGRCTQCYKCAYEYITFVHLGYLKVNLPYYKHCHKILISKMKQVYNIDPSSVNLTKDLIYNIYGIPTVEDSQNWKRP